jgi:uncharacterized protein with HEPN domain
MKRRDIDRLVDVIKAADLVASFTDGFSFERFLSDHLVQSAVIRQLQIVGEACRQVSDQFKQTHPQVPWRRIVGMRNAIVHDYNEVELEIVWTVVEKFLPETVGIVEQIVRAEGKLPKP